MLAQLKDGPKEINVMQWAGRAAFEMMARGGLERSFDPLVAKPEEGSRVFIEALKELVYVYLPSLVDYAEESFGDMIDRHCSQSTTGVWLRLLLKHSFHRP
jgi:hypothetical protein